MSEIAITVGRDVSSYTVVRVPSGKLLSHEALYAIARKAEEEKVFEVDHNSSTSLRVVCAKTEDGTSLEGCEDVMFEPNYFDFGQVAALFLTGKATIADFVDAAKHYKIIDSETEVVLPSINIGVQVLNGCVSSVEIIGNKYLKGIATIIDHDEGENTANYTIDGTDVRVDDVQMGNIVSYELNDLEGSIGALVEQFHKDVEENGIHQVLLLKDDWEVSSDDADEIIFEAEEVADRDDGSLAFVLKFDRDQLGCGEIMSSIEVIKVNNNDENDREVIFEDNLYATELILRLMEETPTYNLYK